MLVIQISQSLSAVAEETHACGAEIVTSIDSKPNKYDQGGAHSSSHILLIHLMSFMCCMVSAPSRLLSSVSMHNSQLKSMKKLLMKFANSMLEHKHVTKINTKIS